VRVNSCETLECLFYAIFIRKKGMDYIISFIYFVLSTSFRQRLVISTYLNVLKHPISKALICLYLTAPNVSESAL
jgi:hypothetical protein